MRDRGEEARLQAELRCLSVAEKVLLRALLAQHPIRRWYAPEAGGLATTECVRNLLPGLATRGLLELKPEDKDALIVRFRLAAGVGAATRAMGWRSR